MINCRLWSCIFLISAMVCQPSFADIYKWKDSEGKLRYSDVPPKSDTQYQVLNKKKSSNALDANKNTALLTNGKNTKEATDIDNKTIDHAKENVEKTKAPPVLQVENVAINLENCKAAKANLATYKNGGRIKRVSEKGETEYLDGAEIAGLIKSAQKDVEKYCQ